LSAIPGAAWETVESAEKLVEMVHAEAGGKVRYGLAGKEGGRDVFSLLELPDSGAVATLPIEGPLDGLASKGGEVDYIHGEEELLGMTDEKCSALLLPPFAKQGLFETVARHGALPRKSFSMGEAEEKRFYLESRYLFI
jgi:hypothetical protein